MSKTPVALYVIWHPETIAASKLASGIYKWFHATSEALQRSGLGLPVYFRSGAWTSEKSTPRPVDTADAVLNVVVPLADENMVADPDWVDYVENLALDESVALYPVALDQSAYRLPESIRRLNFLRIDSRFDTHDKQDDQDHAGRQVKLLRQLTEVLGRELTSRVFGTNTSTQVPAALTVFLSHAKRDGTQIARTVRETISNIGQVRTFFDDSDLPLGHPFASELENALDIGSVATIAIVTDAYASRPWCRREVLLSRTPRPDRERPDCWSIQPVLVLDGLEKALTRNIPELGNAPVVRWREDHANQSIDALALDIVQTAYLSLRAKCIRAKPGRQIINWIPDIESIMSLLHQSDSRVSELVYPGHGLPYSDLQLFRQYFPDIAFRTFEETELDILEKSQPLAGKIVGISVGPSAHMNQLGFGEEHILEMTVRVARCLIDLGSDISFGGMLGSTGLVETLMTLVRSMQPEDSAEQSGRRPSKLISFQRWPWSPDNSTIATNIGISDFVITGCPLEPDDMVEHDSRVRSPQQARQHALALSTMRKAMNSGGCKSTSGSSIGQPFARVIMGGRRHGFGGFLPGVIEEALYAIESGIPVYLLGGFGGGGALLADAIQGPDLPAELNIEFHQKNNPKFNLLCTALQQHDEMADMEALYNRLRLQVKRVRSDIASGLANGLDTEENSKLMKSESMVEVIGLLYRGLNRCLLK